MENPEFLKEKYNLHKSPEVDSAAKRTEARTSEQLSQNPQERIQNYLDRFSDVLNREDPDKRERGIEALKHVLHKKFIIKPDEIPENYFANQQRIAREQGHGDVEIGDEQRQQLTEVIITDQKSSLDKWIDYLASPDATYPDWLKYYATRSILSMGEYNKERKAFTKRTEGTTKPFPDLNREALAYVLDVIDKKYKGEKINLATLEAEDKEQFQKLLQGENFAKLYAWAVEKVTPESQDLLTNTEGEWVKYDQDSDHMPLVESLQGHGTGWCTAGESTAQTQLEGGDFYVYYSNDKDGKATIPRVAIRMNGEDIGEVRGIAAEQNLDPYIGGVVQEKLKEFPDGAEYEKKTEDMKFITAIENKVKKGEELNKDELIFLYEINRPIYGFGYENDPRIKELREQRNVEEDMPIIFECSKEQIARGIDQIRPDTKAYIGPLFPEIFKKGFEHIYTAFPENKIRTEKLEMGGKTTQEIEEKLSEEDIIISEGAKEMFRSGNFPISKNRKEIELVRFDLMHLLDISEETSAKTLQIHERIKELGLEFCPPEIALWYIFKDNPVDDMNWLLIGMEGIAVSTNPCIFTLSNRGGTIIIDITSARTEKNSAWNSRWEMVFRVPSSSTSKEEA